mmetsp:Transcript_22127/g.66359  ORF Transcript_22127/g.66359 Transcript_22127/m.66359 type:complete len:284 (+) Transcript_22127:595-1446(+)
MRRFVSHRAHRVDRVDDQALSQPAGPRKWRSGTLPRRRDGCADLDLLRLQRLWTERPLQRMRRGESRSLLLRRGRGRRPVSVCGGESLEAPGAVGRRRRARDRIGNVHNGRARQRIGNVQNVAFVWGRRAIAHLLEFFHGVSGVSLARLWSQADVRADRILYVRILRRRVGGFYLCLSASVRRWPLSHARTQPGPFRPRLFHLPILFRRVSARPTCLAGDCQRAAVWALARAVALLYPGRGPGIFPRRIQRVDAVLAQRALALDGCGSRIRALRLGACVQFRL